MTDRPTRIALLGKPHEIWPVAALLARNLPPRIALVIIEDAGAQEESAALTIPADHRFHHQLGITAGDLVLRCNGTIGLGTDCIGWQGEGSRFFAARSGELPRLNGVALHQIMLRAALMRREPEKLAYLFQPFRFAARAAMAGKLAGPVDDAQSPLRLLGPTVQCDRADYAALLQAQCRAVGIEPREGRPVDLARAPGSEAIASVRLEDGEDIAADLFIDASGALANLADDDGETGFGSLSANLAFDRIIAGPGAKPGDSGHTVARALPGGLLLETPLGQGQRSELLFSSTAMDEETALALVGGDKGSSPFAAGHAERPWTGNLVRMGGAAGRFGPYQSADMLALYEQALRLVEWLPVNAAMAIEARGYNRGQSEAIAEIRDFSLLPFLLNGRTDAPWAAMREARPPESLQMRIDQFASRGRFLPYEHALLDDQSWIDLLIGFGVVPRRHDPLAASLDMPRIAPILRQMVAAFTAAIDAMPTQAEYRAQCIEAAEDGAGR
ncbi:tryptophan 7-halogenase [Parasphingopyxis marina]|uniref:Tryptophan 7-halogenase n=1 Tax=Parasphingopyxis marina TaxID=2761622 RepID=A0A842HWW9_9SPHN|nr:tryptophan 7-halogenase [Parasphingopyxis marina]MBC2776779.1 tryptophan 7-halogenase [Parasphingopyxis marina]